WSVNILATVGGEEMFKGTAYINETKQLISSERKKIISELSTWKNIKLYDTQSNFILLKILNKNITAAEIFDKLIKHKIVIRDASDFPYLDYEFLRFCILSKEHNQLLLTKLKEIIE
ncbi:MAG: threonine-phosphate decarboxylase, partial [Firmicutes bacterium]|nr:threonine-phosphate decarboxylase [Bacillota bacterium]